MFTYFQLHVTTMTSLLVADVNSGNSSADKHVYHHVKHIYRHVYKLMLEDVPLVEFMYFVLIRMPGESYRRRLRSLLLYLCQVFRALINSFVCCL